MQSRYFSGFVLDQCCVLCTQAYTQNKKTEEIVHIQSQELKNILEAPVADGQNLTPEELKKIYHQKISNATKNNNIQIEVIEK